MCGLTVVEQNELNRLDGICKLYNIHSSKVSDLREAVLHDGTKSFSREECFSYLRIAINDWKFANT